MTVPAPDRDSRRIHVIQTIIKCQSKPQGVKVSYLFRQRMFHSSQNQTKENEYVIYLDMKINMKSSLPIW